MRISRASAPAALLVLLLWGVVAGTTAADASLRADVGHESWWPELESPPEQPDPVSHDEHEGDQHEGETPAHDHAPTEPVDRPLPLLLGAFGVVNGGVMLTAGVIRHRERAARAARQASRAQRRAVPASGPRAGS